jgi:hypothetical protein
VAVLRARLPLLALLLAACSYDYAALSGKSGGAGSGNGGSGGGGGSVGAGGAGSSVGAAGTAGLGGAAGTAGVGAGGSPTGLAGAGGTAGTGNASGSGGATGGAGSAGREGKGGAGGRAGASGGTEGGAGSGGSAGGMAGTGAGGGTTGVGGAGTAGGGGAGAGGASGSAGVGGAGAGGAGGSSAGTGGSGGGQVVPPDPDLVLYYPLEGANGVETADTSMFPGGPRNAVVSLGGTGGAAGFSTMRQVGMYALSLTSNGSTGGGYLAIPSLQTLTPGPTTVATWVYVTAQTKWQRVFDLGTGTTTYMFLTTAEGTDTKLVVRFAITTMGANMEQRIDSGAALSINAWHHLAVVLADGSPYTGSLYVDGALAGSNTAMTLHPADLGATTANYIGRSQYTADPYFKGLIDDFRVYRRALTTTDITTLYGLR